MMKYIMTILGKGVINTGLVVAPVAQDISLMIAGQMTTFIIRLGVYAIKKVLSF